MFHSYSGAKLALLSLNGSREHLDRLSPMACEAGAGAVAGVVQATLNTPLWNVKLRRPGTDSLLAELHVLSRSGLRSLFRNLGRGNERLQDCKRNGETIHSSLRRRYAHC